MSSLSFVFVPLSLVYQTCKRMYDDSKSSPNNINIGTVWGRATKDVLTIPNQFLTTVPIAESSEGIPDGSARSQKSILLLTAQTFIVCERVRIGIVTERSTQGARRKNTNTGIGV